MKRSILIAMLFMVACGKNSNQHAISVPDVIQAENRRGNIIGIILLYDANGKEISDKSGVTVSIDNSTVNTNTSADGKWTLDSIPYGIYDITYTKDGFGKGKIMGVNHVATNHATTIIKHSRNLNAISTTEVKAIQTASFDSNPTITSLINTDLTLNGIHINPTFDNQSGINRPVRIFFSDNAGVSASNYLVSEKILATGKPNDMTDYNFDIRWFQVNGFKLGQRVFVTAHGDGFTEDLYEDPIYGIAVFPSLSVKAAPVVSFVIPAK